jgi:hypothetical protein
LALPFEVSCRVNYEIGPGEARRLALRPGCDALLLDAVDA